jgi:hypothetical protein
MGAQERADLRTTAGESSSSSIEALGEPVVTSLADWVAETAAIFRARLTEGWLVPEQHGLDAVVGVP